MAPEIKAGRGGDPKQRHWNLEYLDRSDAEARAVLNDSEHAHLVDQCKALAEESNPACPKHGLSVDQVEDFYELREKGGPLGKKNIRVFFFLEHERRTIVVLGVLKKEREGQTPPATKKLMQRRKRLILEGVYPRRAAISAAEKPR